MDELKKKRLKNKVIKQMERQVNYYRAYDHLINIYVSMLIHKEEIENQLQVAEDPEEKAILTSALDKLNEDIEEYKEQLCL